MDDVRKEQRETSRWLKEQAKAFHRELRDLERLMKQAEPVVVKKALRERNNGKRKTIQ